MRSHTLSVRNSIATAHSITVLMCTRPRRRRPDVPDGPERVDHVDSHVPHGHLADVREREPRQIRLPVPAVLRIAPRRLHLGPGPLSGGKASMRLARRLSARGSPPAVGLRVAPAWPRLWIRLLLGPAEVRAGPDEQRAVRLRKRNAHDPHPAGRPIIPVDGPTACRLIPMSTHVGATVPCRPVVQTQWPEAETEECAAAGHPRAAPTRRKLARAEAREAPETQRPECPREETHIQENSWDPPRTDQRTERRQARYPHRQ